MVSFLCSIVSECHCFAGDTAYSKKWVLSVLLHMMEDEKENGDGGEGLGDDGKNDTSEDGEGVDESDTDVQRKNDPNQISPELEEELCELWDMTMDSVSHSGIVLSKLEVN